MIPRPLAFYDPIDPNSFVSTTPTNGVHPRSHRSLVAKGDFRLLDLDTAAYAMDQVLPIPLTTAKIVRTLFYPPDMPDASDPTLCRLYFGKVIQAVGPGGRPNRFFNSANFPLDVARYCKILAVAQQEDCEYPAVEEIAYGMGEALGRLHWCAGYDGRDVEFIMGGASFSGVVMNVIDFNQMRTWNRAKDEIPHLVDAFFINDPYYPRAHPTDPLYREFKDGYQSAYPEFMVELGQAFLCAIEEEQARRSSLFY